MQLTGKLSTFSSTPSPNIYQIFTSADPQIGQGVVDCRNMAFKNLGIVEGKRHRTPHVTMLKKDGRRLLENAEDLTSQLKQKFKSAKFEIVDGKAIATMSLREQVSLFSFWLLLELYLLQGCLDPTMSTGMF